jgi:hypothetical protein
MSSLSQNVPTSKEIYDHVHKSEGMFDLEQVFGSLPNTAYEKAKTMYYNELGMIFMDKLWGLLTDEEKIQVSNKLKKTYCYIEKEDE